MPVAGDGHSHVVLLAVVDGVLVVDGAAGVCHGDDAGLVGNLYTVGKGEEGVAGHDGSVEVEAEGLGFGNGLAQGIDARGLAGATGTELTVLGQHDGVTFGVLDKDGGEGKVGGLLRGDGGGGDALGHVGSGGDYGVAVLHKDAVEGVAEHLRTHLESVALEDDAVLLASEDGQRLVVVVGSDAHFEEDFVHLFCHLFGDGAVGDQHTAEGGDGVAGQSVGPGLEQGGTGGEAAGVVVLEDGEGGVGIVVDKGTGSIDVAYVVIGYFFSVELGEAGVEVAVVAAFLVGVLAIAQGVGLVAAEFEHGQLLLLVEVVEDGGVVVGTDVEGIGSEAAALLEGGGTVLLGVDVEKLLVVVDGGDNDNVVEVFGGGTDEGNASDVNLLDDVLLGGAGSHGGLERVEVDDDEVDFRNFVLCQLFTVGVHVATAEDAAEDFGVEGLDTASEDGGIAGQGFDGYGFDAEFLDEFLCAAGGIDGDALAVEGFDDVFKTVFVVDGDEG